MKTKSYTEDVAAGRIDEMSRIAKLERVEDRESHDDYREPLCIDTLIKKRIMLSWGGPSDGFDLYFTMSQRGDGLHLSHGTYWRQDWGSYKESALRSDEAEAVFQFYMGGEADIC